MMVPVHFPWLTRLLSGFSWGLLSACLVVPAACAADANGNEFSLNLKEAKTPVARKAVLDEGLGKQHFFRYLAITFLQESETNGYPVIDVDAVEPSSGLTVRFAVVKSMSLAVLKEDPVSRIGDALAVSGKIKSAEPEKRLIVLAPVIVRYKDILSPKRGQELVSERQISGIVYSFTGGKEAVNVSKRDEDLLQFEDQMVAERGKDGWARFLLDEIAKRDKAEQMKRDSLGIYRKSKTPAGEPHVPAPTQGIITDDEQ